MTTTSEALFTLPRAIEQILTFVSKTIPFASLEVAFADPRVYLYAAQKDDKVSLARAFASLSFVYDWRESACRRAGRWRISYLAALSRRDVRWHFEIS